MSKDTGHAFVAAFANSNCGDVSGNFNPGSKMGEFSPASVADPATQIQRMMDTGQAQFDMAHSLIKEKNRAVLHGPLDWNHRFVDMTALTGTVAALGLSFTAGSTEDGDSGNSIDWSVFNDLNINGQVSEGIFLVKPGDYFTTNDPGFWSFLNGFSTGAGMAIDAITGLFKTTRSIDPVEILKEYVQDILAVRAAHFPKPVLLVPGNLPALHAMPQILPLQILRIGSFALTGIPGEITAVAGMQLRETVRSRLAGNEGLVALGAYANGYAQYFTTAEEYAGQDYEGASNLYGPASLAALLSQYDSMSKEITNGQKTQNGVSAPDLTAFISGIATKRRMTVRNLSSMSVEFWVFGPNETNFKPGRELISLTVDRGGEVAVMLDGRLGLLDWDVQVILNRLSGTGQYIRCWSRSLIVIDRNGVGTDSNDYVAPPRRVP